MTSIDQAFQATPRQQFLPPEEQEHAEWDVPLPIGYGQTNSQPTTVRMMLGWLDPRSGDRVLDVGAGSGWTSALLAHIVGPKGHVTAVEKVPELVEFGRQNCQRLALKNVEFQEALQSVVGWPENAPYDRILVSAAAGDVPPELPNQLAPGGRLVIPIKSVIVVIKKVPDGSLEREAYDGFSFVPLV